MTSPEEFTEFAAAAAPRLRRTGVPALRRLAYRGGSGADRAGEGVRLLAQDQAAGRGARLRRPHADQHLPGRQAPASARARFSPTGFPSARSEPPAPETRIVVLNALATLPPKSRAVVVLRYWADLSVEQVAAALGCSPGNVKSQSARALDKLRVVLGDVDDRIQARRATPPEERHEARDIQPWMRHRCASCWTAPWPTSRRWGRSRSKSLRAGIRLRRRRRARTRCRERGRRRGDRRRRPGGQRGTGPHLRRPAEPRVPGVDRLRRQLGTPGTVTPISAATNTRGQADHGQPGAPVRPSSLAEREDRLRRPIRPLRLDGDAHHRRRRQAPGQPIRVGDAPDGIAITPGREDALRRQHRLEHGDPDRRRPPTGPAGRSGSGIRPRAIVVHAGREDRLRRSTRALG